MPQEDWETLFRQAKKQTYTIPADYPVPPVQPFASSTQPFLIACSDDERYYVKSPPSKRTLIAELVVGKLGALLKAPVPEVAFVYLTQEFIDNNPKLSRLGPGHAYGSRFISGLRDSRIVEYAKETENRSRFASLAVLYGLTACDDMQFMYANQAPHLVYSHDHGWFFPGGTAWNMQTLSQDREVDIHREIVMNAHLTQSEILAAIEPLKRLTHQDIVDTIACVPEAWGITPMERISLAKCLARRREMLLSQVCIKG